MIPDTKQLPFVVAELRARLGDAEHLIQSLLARLASLEHPMSQNVFIATTDGGGWQERTTEDGTTFQDFADGRSSASAPMTMEPGGFAILEIPGDGESYFLKLGGGQGLIPVILADDGMGSNGTASVAATYAYNVTDEDGNALGTSMSPEDDRIICRTTGPATTGFGFYDSAGTFHLKHADEVPETIECTPP
jgi:hypothetical protein